MINEHDPFFSSRNTQPDPTENHERHNNGRVATERIKLAGDITDDTAELISALNNEQRPTVAERTFIFDEAKLSTARLPDALELMRQNGYTPCEAIVNYTYLAGAPTSSISVEYSFRETDNENIGDITIRLTSHPDPSHEPTCEIMHPNKTDAFISSISSSDIRISIASLVPDEYGSSTLTTHNGAFHNPDAYESILEGLQEGACSELAMIQFALPGNGENDSDYLAYTAVNSMPQSATIHRSTHTEIGISDIGNPYAIEYATELQFDFQDGITMEYFQTMPGDSPQHTHSEQIKNPSNKLLKSTRNYIRAHVQRIEAVRNPESDLD